MLRMAKTLVRDTPAKPNEPVTNALARLMDHIEVTNEALSRRLRRANPLIVARELEFDRAVDSLWITLRTSLASLAQTFGHPGLDSLSDARKAELGLDALRDVASKAGVLHEQLFAANGTNFTKYSFSAQAEAMAALLRIVEQDQLMDTLEQVAGKPMVDALVVCQAQYEEIARTRMRRNVGVDEDFRGIRTRLRWLISRYKAAVETLYDEDTPESETVVENALRALLMLSAHMTRNPSAGLDDTLDAELVEESPELTELEDQGDSPTEGQDIQADEPQIVEG